MKCKSHSTIVQTLYSNTFYYENDQEGKNILFLFLKINIHLINTLSNLLIFNFIKPMNFKTENEVFKMSLRNLMDLEMKTFK